MRNQGAHLGDQLRHRPAGSDDPQRVNLRFQIERGTPVKEDTVATLKTQGLTGIAYVELSGGTAGSPPLMRREGQQHPVIQTKPSLSTRLETVLTDVLTTPAIAP